MEVHIEGDALLIFLQHRDREATAHNRKINMRAVCRQRYDPPAFAASLIANAPQSRASKPLCFSHRGDGVGSENVKVPVVPAAGHTGAAFVIDERADALRWEHPL